MHISWLAEETFFALEAFSRLDLGPDIGRLILASILTLMP